MDNQLIDRNIADKLCAIKETSAILDILVDKCGTIVGSKPLFNRYREYILETADSLMDDIQSLNNDT